MAGCPSRGPTARRGPSPLELGVVLAEAVITVLTDENLVEHLDEALDHLLAVRLRLAGGRADHVPAPTMAFDVALTSDTGRYRKALAAHKVAFEALKPHVPAERLDLLVELADAATGLSRASTEVGWRLGLTAVGVVEEES
jgi:hypothetical protein